MNEIQHLYEVMKKLRSPEGCPWDREQTHQTLTDCLMGEAAEYLDAVEDQDDHAMQEELGDLLMQIVLNAVIAEERGKFTFRQVVQDITEKMIRRHPHVFGDASVENARQVVKLWEQIKKKEKSDRKSLLDGVPRHIALQQAEKLQKKAAKVGFDWKNQADILDKIQEELDELKAAAASGNDAHIREEAGDLLFAAVNFIRFRNEHAEDVLAQANHKFKARFQAVERIITGQDREMKDATPEEMDQLWNQAKADGIK